MAAIRCKHEALVVLSANSFVVYGDGRETELQLPGKCQVAEEDEEEKNQRKDVVKTDNANCVLAAAFSPSGKYFAIGDNAKQLHLYAVNSEWKLLSTRTLARRCTSVAFTHSDTELVVADRTGDVYRYPVMPDPEGAGNLLMGHLSMVLDVTMTSDDKYVITCDRDEKVRVSGYPNAYNIQTYCLLHTEYVSQVVYIDQIHCLLSGSGVSGRHHGNRLLGDNGVLQCCRVNLDFKDLDGRIAIWDLSGSCHDCVLEEDRTGQAGDQPGSDGQTAGQREPLSVKRIVYDHHCAVVAAIFHRSRRLHFYTLLQSETCKPRLCREQEVELAGEPWDIEFGSQHKLWVLQACENNCLVVYACKRVGDQLQVNKSHGEGAVDCIVSKLSAKWDLLKDAVDWRTEFINLSKTKTFDNIQKYLEKKEQRLKGNKSEEPAEKKLKSSG